MVGKNFPISDYLKPHILDARTISHTGAWWTAILLIRDPKSEKPYVAFYKWQKRNGEWKRASGFKINNKKALGSSIECLNEYSERLQ